MIVKPNVLVGIISFRLLIMKSHEINWVIVKLSFCNETHETRVTIVVVCLLH